MDPVSVSVGQDWIDVFSRFSGIVGAILGVILGFLFQEWRQRAGRVDCFLCSNRLDWMFLCDGSYHAGAVEIADKAELVASVDLYNGKSQPVGLRNLRVTFRRGTTDLLSSPPFDLDIQKGYHNAARGSELELINLEPRLFERMNIALFITDKTQMQACSSATSVWLTASDHRERTVIRTKLADLDKGRVVNAPR